MFTVTHPEALYAEVGVVQPLCAGDFGSAEIVLGGGTGLLIFDADVADLTALEPGTVHFSVTDSSGCFLTDSLVITSPDSLFGSLSFEYLGISDSVQIVTSVEGGTPPYYWNWGGSVDDSGLALAPINLGWYVQDINGCLDLGALSIGLNTIAGISFANDGAAWTCYRSEGALTLDGPRGKHLNVSIYDLSGRMVLDDIQVSAFAVLDLWTDVPVVVTGIDDSGELFRWLR